MSRICIRSERLILTGHYPDNAQIHLKDGLWIGSELIKNGDCVRVLDSKHGKECAAIMLIRSIYLEWTELKQYSKAMTDSPNFFAVGELFKLHQTSTTRETPLKKNEFRHIPAPLHRKELYPPRSWPQERNLTKIPGSLLIGRLHHFLKTQQNEIRSGLGVNAARHFGTNAYKMIYVGEKLADHEITWSVYDDRAHSLGLHSISGSEAVDNEGIKIENQSVGSGVEDYHDRSRSKSRSNSVADRFGHRLVVSDAHTTDSGDYPVDEFADMLKGLPAKGEVTETEDEDYDEDNDKEGSEESGRASKRARV
jgi:hypothetical protein